MNLCVIPARGGSKRIQYKNIKNFNGKPIIAYSIEAAIECEQFSQIIVSTDDPKIAKVAEKYGANVPFIRPKALSDDFIGTIPVIKHAIEFMEDNNNYFNNVCCLYATAPFIKSKTLIDSYKQLISSKKEYCFSVTSYSFPIQRALKIDKSNNLKMFQPSFFNKRSQDLEESFHDAGQFYWGKADAFKKELKLFSKYSSPFILPRYLVQDIDNMEDWIRAEIMYTSLKNTQNIL